LGFASWLFFLIAGLAIEKLDSYAQVEKSYFGIYKPFALEADFVDTGIETANGKLLKYATIDGNSILFLVNRKKKFF